MAKNDVRSGKIDIKGIVESGELEGTATTSTTGRRNKLVVATDGLSPGHIQRRIITMRGVQVLFDRDLAELYCVPVKRLNA